MSISSAPVIPAQRPSGADDRAQVRIEPGDLNRSSSIPLYQQLAQQLQRAIATGELAPGSLLGNEIEFAQHCGVSRPTTRRAIAELVGRGVLVANAASAPRSSAAGSTDR